VAGEGSPPDPPLLRRADGGLRRLHADSRGVRLEPSDPGPRSHGSEHGLAAEATVGEGDGVWILVANPDAKRWWRTLSGNGHVRVRLRGRDFQTDAHLVEGRSEPGSAAAGLRAFSKRWPRVGERYEIRPRS